MTDAHPMGRFGASLARRGAQALLIRPVGMALAFATHVMLARLMGPGEYGVFVYVYAWTYFLGLLCRLGYDRSIVRFGTVALAAGDAGEFFGLADSALRTAFVAGTVVAVAVAGVLAEWPELIGAHYQQCFLIGCAFVPVLAVHNVYEGFAQSFRRVVQATLPEQVLRQGFLGLFTLAYYLKTGVAPTAAVAIFLHGAGAVVTLAVDHAWYRLVRPRGGTAAPFRREWLNYAVQMSVVANLGTWLLQADLFLVGALLGPASASLYSAASRIANLVAWVELAGVIVFGPVVAELAARGARAELERYSKLVARWTLAAAGGLTLVLWELRDFILGLFGPDFLKAAAPMGVLCLGYVLREAFGPAPTVLNLSGAQQTTLRVLVAAVPLNLALTLLLIPQAGMSGAAASTALTVVGLGGVLWWRTRRRQQIDTSILGATAVPGAAP